ncbi:type II toxin-antitoxin system VapC family toxin [Fodinibius sp.]|uniref:type II toxin-antitoxin system VapC family toxin n=1 Tax=Fodinibius sp. TaxID=1872440 RepID=UPI002ACE881E|nr:type II toxin-antitoxin system VapC family toxin [Fodinibius sp.]MDZ7660651.1 type II toxin-antitoxin system VapC family toxin [Fodinibius sp.]
MNYVLDASVGIKWFLPENLSHNAYVLLEKEKGFEIPDLFLIEIDSILTKRVRKGNLNVIRAAEIANTVRDLSFITTNYQAINSIAFRIATAYYISLYDAIYVALAVIKDKKMITADKKLVRAVENTPLEVFVVYLGNIKE